MFVDVVLPSRRYRVFTYRVPVHLQGKVCVGSPVVVPLGTTLVTGVVVRVSQSPSESDIVKNRSKSWREIHSVHKESVDLSLSPLLVQLAKEISAYYLAPVSACLPLIVPPLGMKLISRVFLTEKGRQILVDGSSSLNDTLLLRKLEARQKGMLVSSFCRSGNLTQATFRRLKKNGWIEERHESHSPPETPSVKNGASPLPALGFQVPSYHPEWDDGRKSGLPPGFDRIVQALARDMFQEEICVAPERQRRNALIQTVEQALRKQKRVIILAPEIQHAEALALCFKGILGNRVEVFHGDRSFPGRVDQWHRIGQGEVDIVVGTRSAIFLPLPRVGLIWVEREEDASYKEEHLPYYHAREVAGMRAKLENGLVVYSSTLPSLEMYARFREQVVFSNSHPSCPRPVIKIVDVRVLPFGTVLSPPLCSAISNGLSQREPVILFVNRKGFSQGLTCRDCGHSPTCPECGVMLKLFQRPSRLLCSYCGRSETAPERCPTCQGTVFRFPGFGTQRVEEEVAALFPAASFTRFDRDKLKTDREAEVVLRLFREGEIHILIGTEWLFHRMNPPRARTVGLLQADLGLQVPDFRSAERTYHALSSAVGMAEPGQESGTVIIQTRNPDHHVLQAIIRNNAEIFYNREMDFREMLGYPPFSHLLLFVITGTQPDKVRLFVQFFRTRVERVWGDGHSSPRAGEETGSDSFLGPIQSKKPGGLKKVRTLFLLKTQDLRSAQQRILALQQECRERFPFLPVVMEVHVDPMEIQ